MKSRIVKKGEILQVPGVLNSKVYHVKKGLLRSYFIDSKGKEHIFIFASEGWLIADSNPPNEPSVLFIDALEDSDVVELEKKAEQIEEHTSSKLIKRIAALQNRVIMLMSASTIERYEYFMSIYPDIAQRVPQRMIASYLGVTPEALSKVKGERNKKA